MANQSKLEKLAVPMFIAGLLSMLFSAGMTVTNSAKASSPVEYKKVTLTYLTNGSYASDSFCGSSSNSYSSGSWNDPSFRSRSLSGYGSDKQILCTATLYVVTNVEIPTPKPVPTVTVIYRPSPSATPTYHPTGHPVPTYRPTATPTPLPTRWIHPTPLPTRGNGH